MNKDEITSVTYEINSDLSIEDLMYILPDIRNHVCRLNVCGNEVEFRQAEALFYEAKNILIEKIRNL